MSDDIESFIAKCSVCSKFGKANQREPLINHPVPERPWSKLGADLFEFGNKTYLVVVDYYSKFPEVKTLENHSAKAVIRALKYIFSRHGAPDELISDNNPFDSYELKVFAKEWGFKITTSIPRYPVSNGQSERYVGIVKQLLRKALEDHKDPAIALLDYRNTPVSGLKYSPAQLLMSRRLKDKLPVASKLLKPAVADAKHDLEERQKKQKKYYDRGTRKRSPFKIGDSVRIKSNSDRTWKQAVVTGEHPAPRSYLVTTDEGSTYRRNTKFLKKSAEPKPKISPPIDDMPLISQSTLSTAVPSVNQPPPMPNSPIPTPPRRYPTRDRKPTQFYKPGDTLVSH